MNKHMIYVMDILAFFILSIVSVVVSYSNLTYVETVENEYNVFMTYSMNITKEFIGYAIMAVALIFMISLIYRVNKSLIEQGIGTVIFKEIALLFIITFLVGFYAVAPFIFMVSLPNQVIFANVLSQVIKYAIYFIPFIFYILMLIYMIINKIKNI